jgi:tetratricopeptide (TPR) repeat protein
MGEDPATVARAREAYHKGNVKLFAGDTAGAIALYRESLKIYPGYVAGYRGLGLGYEAAGDTDEALKAFHTYVRTVPSANDTPIIRRRIDRLESLKSGGAPQ